MTILLVEDRKGIAGFVKKGLLENAFSVDVPTQVLTQALSSEFISGKGSSRFGIPIPGLENLGFKPALCACSRVSRPGVLYPPSQNAPSGRTGINAKAAQMLTLGGRARSLGRKQMTWRTDSERVPSVAFWRGK